MPRSEHRWGISKPAGRPGCYWKRWPCVHAQRGHRQRVREWRADPRRGHVHGRRRYDRMGVPCGPRPRCYDRPRLRAWRLLAIRRRPRQRKLSRRLPEHACWCSHHRLGPRAVQGEVQGPGLLLQRPERRQQPAALVRAGVHDSRARRQRGDVRFGVRRAGDEPGVLPHGEWPHVLNVLELLGPGRQLAYKLAVVRWGRAERRCVPRGVRDRAARSGGSSQGLRHEPGEWHSSSYSYYSYYYYHHDRLHRGHLGHSSLLLRAARVHGGRVADHDVQRLHLWGEHRVSSDPGDVLAANRRLRLCGAAAGHVGLRDVWVRCSGLRCEQCLHPADATLSLWPARVH